VICKGSRFSLGALDLGQDLAGVFGSGEWLGVLVAVIDEGADPLDQLLDRGERAAAHHLDVAVSGLQSHPPGCRWLRRRNGPERVPDLLQACRRQDLEPTVGEELDDLLAHQ
jgi:hypothetical protein